MRVLGMPAGPLGLSHSTLRELLQVHSLVRAAGTLLPCARSQDVAIMRRGHSPRPRRGCRLASSRSKRATRRGPSRSSAGALSLFFTVKCRCTRILPLGASAILLRSEPPRVVRMAPRLPFQPPEVPQRVPEPGDPCPICFEDADEGPVRLRPPQPAVSTHHRCTALLAYQVAPRPRASAGHLLPLRLRADDPRGVLRPLVRFQEEERAGGHVPLLPHTVGGAERDEGTTTRPLGERGFSSAGVARLNPLLPP